MSGLSEALVAAQMDMPPLHKDSEAEVLTKKGGKYRYTYLSLQSLLDAVLPVLNEHGLCVMQKPIADSLETRIIHTSGDAEVALTPLVLPEGFTAQEQGSAITYARRYALMSMLALAPDEDDDGAAASSRSQTSGVGQTGESRTSPAAPEEPPQAAERPRAASERPAARETLRILKETVETLQKGFPSPDPNHSYWDDVRAYMIGEFAKSNSAELTEAQVQELILHMEKRLVEAQRQTEIPFG